MATVIANYAPLELSRGQLPGITHVNKFGRKADSDISAGFDLILVDN